MSPRFVLGRENMPCVAEVVNRSLKADCTDFTIKVYKTSRNCYHGDDNVHTSFAGFKRTDDVLKFPSLQYCSCSNEHHLSKECPPFNENFLMSTLSQMSAPPLPKRGCSFE